MNFVSKCYYNKPILSFINEKISEGHHSFYELDDNDKDILVIHCLNSLGNDAYTLLIEEQGFDKTLCLFKRFLSSANQLDAKDTLQSLRDTAANAITEEMNLLFEEQISLHEIEKNYWRKTA